MTASRSLGVCRAKSIFDCMVAVETRSKSPLRRRVFSKVSSSVWAVPTIDRQRLRQSHSTLRSNDLIFIVGAFERIGKGEGRKAKGEKGKTKIVRAYRA